VEHRRVEFADTDMAGIVHFARFFVYMETAEHRFREALGFPVMGGKLPDGTPLVWPRVQATCDYKSPARLGDTLEIRVSVTDRGSSSLAFGFSFHRGDTLVAVGEMTSVCCRLEPEVRPAPIPPEMVEALGAVT
jgi:YbgC/YbaW family acyl-CoA thioester hydrolase